MLTVPVSPDSLTQEIGRDVSGIVEYFHGKIDDVRLYKWALSEAEIQELFGITTDLDIINPQKLK